MFRHGDISTEVDKGPFFFSLAAFVGSTAAAVLLFALGGGNGLAVFGAIMMLIVGLASFAVVFAMVTDWAFVEGQTLHMHYLLKERSIPFDDIEKITYKDDLYTVYTKSGKESFSMNAKLTGIGKVISALDKNGVRFE